MSQFIINTALQEQIEQILDQSRNNKKFLFSGKTYKDIFNLAAGFLKSLESSDSSELICICAEDKGIIAAAVIASLCGGPGLILPHSFSNQVLTDTKNATGFTKAIIDKEREMPAGIESIKPKKVETHSLSISRDLDSEFIKLFTGGSTGNPQIWSKTARNIFTEAFYLADKFKINEDDLFVSTVPPYHIYGFLFSVIIPFIAASKVIDNICTFPREIISAIDDNEATIFVSVPMHYKILNGSKIDGKSLKKAFSSAGPLNKEDGEYFHNQTNTDVIEIYGSTETGGIATRCRANGEESLNTFNNIEWKIDDERLLVKSEFISADLPLNRDGFFVTGDRVQYDGNDSFMLLGRADGIIKIAGKRVDTGEILEKIKKLDGIKNAYILPVQARKGKDFELNALIESDIDESELKKLFSDILEPHAVPKRIKVVDKIPVSSTGKYDRSGIEKLLKA